MHRIHQGVLTVDGCWHQVFFSHARPRARVSHLSLAPPLPPTPCPLSVHLFFFLFSFWFLLWFKIFLVLLSSLHHSNSCMFPLPRFFFPLQSHLSPITYHLTQFVCLFVFLFFFSCYIGHLMVSYWLFFFLFFFFFGHRTPHCCCCLTFGIWHFFFYKLFVPSRPSVHSVQIFGVSLSNLLITLQTSIFVRRPPHRPPPCTYSECIVSAMLLPTLTHTHPSLPEPNHPPSPGVTCKFSLCSRVSYRTVRIWLCFSMSIIDRSPSQSEIKL